MKEYRVITNGSVFRIQRRGSVFGWWTVHNGAYNPRPLNFDTRELAVAEIKARQKAECDNKVARQWYPV